LVDNGRRKSKRARFIKEIEVAGVGMQRCSDISTGGLYLETVHDFREESAVELRLKLRDIDNNSIVVQARVLYVHKGVGVGLGFVNLTQEDREKIRKFIDTSE